MDRLCSLALSAATSAPRSLSIAESSATSPFNAAFSAESDDDDSWGAWNAAGSRDAEAGEHVNPEAVRLQSAKRKEDASAFLREARLKREKDAKEKHAAVEPGLLEKKKPDG